MTGSGQSVMAVSRSVWSIDPHCAGTLSFSPFFVAFNLHPNSRTGSFYCCFWNLSCEYSSRGRCRFCFDSHLLKEYPALSPDMLDVSITNDDDDDDDTLLLLDGSVDGEGATDGVVESKSKTGSYSYSCNFWNLSCEYNSRGKCRYCLGSRLSEEYPLSPDLLDVSMTNDSILDRVTMVVL